MNMLKDNIIGIDIGSSTTKIIEYKENEIVNKKITANKDIIKEIDSFLYENKIDIKDIYRFVLTGIGANRIDVSKYNVKTEIIKEFDAIGTGGLYLSGSEKAIVVSIGTGTAFVRADKLNLKHLGGTGVGAGTLTNLCKRFAGTKDFDEILNLSKIGNLDNVDLKIGDITEEKINTLPSDLTLSNFGNLKPSASNSDIILGILNMIFETIGMMAAFSSINDDIKEIVLIGNIVTLPCVKSILKKIENLYDISFIIPNEAQYAVALGAIIKSATKGSGPFFPIL